MKKLLGIILLTILVVFSSCNSNADAFLAKLMECRDILSLSTDKIDEPI